MWRNRYLLALVVYFKILLQFCMWHLYVVCLQKLRKSAWCLFCINISEHKNSLHSVMYENVKYCYFCVSLSAPSICCVYAHVRTHAFACTCVCWVSSACVHTGVPLIYLISRPIRHTMIFSLEILEKNNDECILIVVIYWEKTGLLHTKISKRNIICSSQKPRKLLSLPLKSSLWLFSLDASLSSYKMSSSLPSSALLMPHFFKDFTIVSLLTHSDARAHDLEANFIISR